jgi:hypothetical protein
MARLEQEIKTTMRLDEQTHNRLVEFAKPDETWPDLLNRLVDIAEEREKLSTIKLDT